MTINMTVPLEVGIACRDLPALRRFYEDTMGFTFVSDFTIGADKSTPAGLSADGYTVVRLQTSYGERIKLLAPNVLPVVQPQVDFILDRPNAVYLTFIIDDINTAITRLLAVGIDFISGPVRVEVRPGVYLAFCRDPEGNVLELVQYDDISSYRPDLITRIG